MMKVLFLEVLMRYFEKKKLSQKSSGHKNLQRCLQDASSSLFLCLSVSLCLNKRVKVAIDRGPGGQ